MKTLRWFFALWVLVLLTVEWTSLSVNAQEYATQDEQNKRILKQGVVGAGVGAVAAGTSGGSAGKGALIGAGTNVIGNALVDTLTTPSQPQPQIQYVQQAPERAQSVQVQGPPRRGCGRSS